MPRTSCNLVAALFTGALLVLLCALTFSRTSSIPPDFQFQSSVSRHDAELFYAQAKQELRQTYWGAIHGYLKHFQIKLARDHFRNGPGHIEGVLIDANSNVLACVKFRDGNTFWITLESGRDRALAKKR